MAYNIWNYFDSSKSERENRPPRRERLRLMPNSQGASPARDYSHLFTDSNEIVNPRPVLTQAPPDFEQGPQTLEPEAPPSTRPRLVPNAPVTNALPLSVDEQIAASQSRIRDLEDRNNPDYRNNDRGFWGRVWDVFREGVIGAGAAWNQNAGIQDPNARLMASLGGGIAGGLTGGFNPSIDEQRRRLYDLDMERRRLGDLNQQRTLDVNNRLRLKQMENIDTDNEYNRQRLDYLRDDQQRKIGDRASREQTARMRTVAGMLKDLPSYDPADPRFAEITKALGDVNLPLTPKDAKKKVELKQDARTGAWEAVITDQAGGVETRPVLKADGSQLKTTPVVVMQGEYGLTRQANEQAFTTERDKKRYEQQVKLANLQSDLKMKLEAFKAKEAEARAEKNAQRRAELMKQAQQMRLELQQKREEFQRERDILKGNILEQ